MELLTLLKTLPQTSGVYEFFDEHERLLYIGKAKNLKKRVNSYFRQNPLSPSPRLSPRLAKMISETTHLHYLLTNTEHDALLLENSLIKQLKPKYNILLRDDKTYPYIYYNSEDPYPRFDITRKVLKAKGICYFGPFTKGANDILKSLYELLPLVQSKSCLHGNKACLFYQLGRCHAPCENKITSDDYKKYIKKALKWLHAPLEIVPLLENRMHNLAQQERFEEAAELRDRICNIKSLECHSQIDIAKLQDIDVVNIAKESKYSLLVWLFMRNGRIVSSACESISGDFDEEEVLVRSILNRYNTPLPIAPKTILLPYNIADRDILQTYILEHCGKITLSTARHAYEKELLALCETNAKENLRILHEKSDDCVLEGLCAFGLDNIPLRIECFDVSHFQKQAPIGSMIVSNKTEFDKESYRYYHLHNDNEYANMREMLTRRAKDFINHSPPDLWLLDGGRAQINIAKEILHSFGASVEVLALAKEKIDSKAHRAKGASYDVIYSQDDTFKLMPTDKRLQFLQKLRDEAHRFAISQHRRKKRKDDMSIDLLMVKGIGKAKIKRLLDFFGSFESIANASFDELNVVLDSHSAKNIYAALHHQQETS